MKQTIEKYCKQHGISPETLIDVYQQGLDNIKNMVTSHGAYLILTERAEQIEKHGRTIEHDVKFNTENQLVGAIMMIASNIGFTRAGMKMPKEVFEDLRPEGWGREICWKILDKPESEQLQILGAFAAAEIDRIKQH